MSIQSLSFYQQDRNYWSQAQAQSQAASADAALINVMGAAETNLAKGLASIANQTALKRVDSAISSLVQQALQGSSGGSAASPSSGSSSSSGPSGGGAASTSGSPAAAIGTVPLTTGTSLSTLGILPGGTISVDTGTTLTKYTSSGTDTVGDLINALNVDLPTNANVTASLNRAGRLVITGRNDTDLITIAGSGTDAAAIGFGVGNNAFEPKAPSSAAGASAGSSGAGGSSKTSAASSASSKNSAKKSTSTQTDTAPALLTVATAASILSADGVSGNLVDLLA